MSTIKASELRLSNVGFPIEASGTAGILLGFDRSGANIAVLVGPEVRLRRFILDPDQEVEVVK